MSEQISPNTKVFPNQVISKIVARLPPEDIHRFKSVSKTWNSIITSYLNRTTPTPTWYSFDRNIRLTTTGPAIEFNLNPRPGLATLTLNPRLLSENETFITQLPPQILQSCNGLVLFNHQILRRNDYKAEFNAFFGFYHPDNSLFVANPVTCEFARLPKPEYLPLDMLFGVGFVSCLDKFVVVEYQHSPRTNTAVLQCFSSDTGKWVVKDADYMLPPQDVHPFRPSWCFEFDGRLFWVEPSVGLITWDFEGVDIFADCENVRPGKCRLITLPRGRERAFTTTEMVRGRSFGGVERQGRCLQYAEWLIESDCAIKCWRLKDYMNPILEWSLVYEVSRIDIGMGLYFTKEKLSDFAKSIMFDLHPPFEPDSAYFSTGKFVFSFNFRTRKVESFANLSGEIEFIPFVLPRCPISIPPRLYAAYAKEDGNRYFKEGNFSRAIECYSKSIALSPNAVAYANRAMAYLKINGFRKADDDCTEALKLDSNYFKAYARRAMARKELGNLEGSKEDAKLALKFDPGNQDIKNLYADVKSFLDKAGKR